MYPYATSCIYGYMYTALSYVSAFRNSKSVHLWATRPAYGVVFRVSTLQTKRIKMLIARVSYVACFCFIAAAATLHYLNVDSFDTDRHISGIVGAAASSVSISLWLNFSGCLAFLRSAMLLLANYSVTNVDAVTSCVLFLLTCCNPVPLLQSSSTSTGLTCLLWAQLEPMDNPASSCLLTSSLKWITAVNANTVLQLMLFWR